MCHISYFVLYKHIYVYIGKGIAMSFLDVAFLPSRASFPATFLTNGGRDGGLVTTTCPKAVVGGMQWHAPVKYICSNKASFLRQSKLMETRPVLQR